MKSITYVICNLHIVNLVINNLHKIQKNSFYKKM